MHQLHAPRMLLPDGWAENVLLDVDERGFITDVTPDTAPGDAECLPGPTVPGMVNVHSHAFQRIIAGFTDIAEHPDDSFWSWREAMYRAALCLDPEQFDTAFRHVYIEMLRAGYTSVGEFHYVHHQADGTPHEARSELAQRAIQAAADTGIGLTLLPVLYCHSGFGGQAPDPGQRRFINDVDGFLVLLAEAEQACRGHDRITTGMAFHSLRAVTGDQIRATLAARVDDCPVHIHVAEQQREVEDCLAWSGKRPVEWLFAHTEVDRHWCLIHATHVTDAELASIAALGAVVGLCPVTEANLGDGLFPAADMAALDGAMAIGSDSHASISPVEELRWLEYGQRLQQRRRNRLARADRPAVGDYLYRGAAAAGARALGKPVGHIARGLRADLVVLDGDDPLLADCPAQHLLNRWLFAAGQEAVREVRVAGRRVVQDGNHAGQEAAREAFRALCRQVLYR